MKGRRSACPGSSGWPAPWRDARRADATADATATRHAPRSSPAANDKSRRRCGSAASRRPSVVAGMQALLRRTPRANCAKPLAELSSSHDALSRLAPGSWRRPSARGAGPGAGPDSPLCPPPPPPHPPPRTRHQPVAAAAAAEESAALASETLNELGTALGATKERQAATDARQRRERCQPLQP